MNTTLAWLARTAPIVICFALTGCVTATVQQVRETATSVGEDESVVILGRRNRPSSDETEIDFVECVSKNVAGGPGKDIRVITEQQFVDAMFPWFEPRTAPLHNTDLPELISQPLLAERIRDLGLKYLIWIEGSTQSTNKAARCLAASRLAGRLLRLPHVGKRLLVRGFGVGRAYGPHGRPGQLGCSRNELHACARRADPADCPGQDGRLHLARGAAQDLRSERIVEIRFNSLKYWLFFWSYFHDFTLEPFRLDGIPLL